MPRLTLKNNLTGPQVVRPIVNGNTGSVVIEPGQSFTGEFSDGEASNLRGNTAVFEVTEHGDDGAPVRGNVYSDPDGGKARERAASVLAVFEPLAVRMLATTPEDLADKLNAALDELDELKAKAGGDTKTMTLTEAVASLDDKNEAHWTDAGKPDLDTLKQLTGGDVKRAEVDALDPPRVRVKA